MDPVAPFSPGSISLRLYPHDELPAAAVVQELRAQGSSAAVAGFDGVMTSEHHGGFAGYMPNPLQAAGWLLESMPRGWAAPCPLLLPLRPASLVAEETAWLAAAYPGRVGLGVAAGSLASDFEIMGMSVQDAAERFADGLAAVAGMLGGTDPGLLASDPAIARCRRHPVPVVSAAMSPAAARRAARLGVGLLSDSLSTPERCRHLVDEYREAGGAMPCVLIRRAWVGAPPTRQSDAQAARYRSYAAPGARAHWQGEQMVVSTDAGAVADELAAVAVRAGADALNLRVHMPGVAPAVAREQIAALSDVVTRLRRVWSAGRS
ncbi:MAG TPA: LLM class flavin-dependent oxidoreductase [Acidimicrobiales bacterium]|nr:LLM class flavin-dependent oxidoreductase [Acidimicrobiales bacterium]